MRIGIISELLEMNCRLQNYELTRSYSVIIIAQDNGTFRMNIIELKIMPRLLII